MKKKTKLPKRGFIRNSFLCFVLMLIFARAQAQNPGNCLNFSGTNSHVKLPNGSINTKLTGGKVTIESWILLNSYKPLATICKNWGNTPINGAFHFGMDGTGNKVGIAITQDNNSTQPYVISNDSLQLNKWYHVAFSADGSNLSLYINGKLQGSTPYNGTLLTTNQYTYIGVKPDGVGGAVPPSSPFAGYLNGSLDELRIWNVGRSQAQIRASMLDTISRNTTGLIAYYNFNQGVNGGNNTAITTLNDLTSNATNGQLSGISLTGTSNNWIESYAMAVPPVLTPTNIGGFTFTANWANPVVGVVDTFLLEVSTNSLFTNNVAGSPFKLANSINSKVLVGLNNATKYYYRVSASKNSMINQGLPFFIDSATTATVSTIITGDTSTKITVRGTNIVVDNSLTITATNTIPGANITITSGKLTGDTLWYTGVLPSGVTANYNATTGILAFTGNATAAQYQALLRTVTFKSISSTNLTVRNIAFTLGRAIPFNGHYYEFVAANNISFTNAKTAASARNYFGLQGYLTTVTSAAENNYIASKLSVDAWMGASDEFSQINAATGTTTFANQAASEGKWHWVTGPEKGTQFSNGNFPSTVAVGGRFINWNNNQPDNFINLEHYGQFYGSSVPAGRWNDLALTDLLAGYMCEYGGMAGDPTVVLSFSRNLQLSAGDAPQTISGLQLWLDASDVNNNGANPSNNTAITTWKDRSGAGNDAVVLAGQNAGVLTTNQINGKATVKFNRTSSILGSVYNVSNIDIRAQNMPKVTIFTVYKQGAQTVPAADQAIWGCDNGGWDRFFFSSFPSYNAGGNNPNNGGVSQGTNANVVPNAGLLNKTQLLTAVYDNQTALGSGVYFNGQNIATFTDATTLNAAQTTLRIGFDGDDNCYNGDIAEMIVYNRKLSNCEILSINKYLGNKYGVTFASVGIDTSGPTTFNMGDSVVLSSNITATAYQWLKNGTVISGATSKNYTAKQSGNYQVIVTNLCNDTSAIKQVVVIPITIVKTTAITNITSTSANLSGNVIDTGATAVTERGVVYATTINPTTANTKVIIGSGLGTFSQNVTGLTPSTLYHVRAYAINSVGTSYGADSTFTTLSAVAPNVLTGNISSIGITNATLSGNVTDSGTNAVTERGVVYATTINPTTANTKVAIGSGLGSFSQNVTGLLPSTTYHVRAYAINSVGTSYGADSVFTTLSAPTVANVITGNVTNISNTSASLAGNVIADGGASVTERGIVIATTANPTTVNTKVTIGAGLGNFSQNITALTPNTTYYYRAYAINSVGTSYGADSVFTTLPNPEFNKNITNAFSPDGDGTNDTWVIDNADMLDGHEITVYNIFGQEVFSQTGYNTPWDGKKDGNLVPSGEYYYHIKGSKINIKGALLIKNNQ